MLTIVFLIYQGRSSIVFYILILQGLRDTAFLINNISSLTKQRMTSKSFDHHGELPNKVCFLEIILFMLFVFQG